MYDYTDVLGQTVFGQDLEECGFVQPEHDPMGSRVQPDSLILIKVNTLKAMSGPPNDQHVGASIAGG